ncbi:MAG: hypothetical protein JW931_08935 [Methanomicrobiaceae archaeon]|nr:hypothetical protein [Methanomicrobiaceae archaeon]
MGKIEWGRIKFPVKIIKKEPDAVYMGLTYGLYDTIEFSNGELGVIFDPAMHCKDEMIGKIKKITLGMLLYKVEKIEKPEKKVTGDKNSSGLDIKGQVEEIIPFDDPKKGMDVIVDFGVGKIAFDIDLYLHYEKYGHLSLNVGDYIHASGRVDLMSIE